MIRADHVIKAFRRVRAVDGVCFDLDAGESLALWGSNGAGKTTLIRCLLGMIPFKGSITIGEYDVQRRGKFARSLIGYVPQELAFHDDARLGASIMFFAKLRGIGGQQAREVLERVDLGGHESKRVRDLSGGMKQRLALAIALLADPPIIVLDEPTSNLDATGRDEVVETLIELRKGGKTLVFASHRPDEAHALAGRVLVMEQGRVVSESTPNELWPDHTPIQTMRLHVTGGDDERAAELLREAGHAVHLNGRGLCVSVVQNRKAEPIRVLTGASIVVRDFEILEEIRRDPAIQGVNG